MHYKNNNSDPVCFNPIREGKIATEVRYVCFSGYLGRAENKKSGFICKDPANKSIMSEEHYLRWMELCRQNGLVAGEAVPYTEDGNNCIYIEEHQHEYAVLYATLCCYRWSTHYVKMCYDIIDDNRDISFHQKLHYYLGKTVQNWNHSFTYVSHSSVYQQGGINSNLSLQVSIGWKLFYNELTPKQRASYFKDQYVNNAIVAFAQKNVGSLPIGKIEEVLLEKWKPLYEMGDVGADKYAEMYQKCK